MKILVVTSKNKTSEEYDNAVEIQRRAIAAGHDVTMDWEIDWDELRKTPGGIEKVYAACTQPYGQVWAVEGEDGCVGKGVFSIVNAALRAGKPVFVLRDGNPARVAQARIKDGNSWVSGYGEFIVRYASQEA